MFNLVFLIIGILVGFVLAPTLGACDGSFWDLIEDKVFSKPQKESSLNTPPFGFEFSIVSSAHANETIPVEVTVSVEEPTVDLEEFYTAVEGVKSPWFPTVVEKHTSSLESKFEGQPGFGVITPCNLDDESCFYALNFSSTPLHYLIDYHVTIDNALKNLVGVMTYEERCLDAGYMNDIPTYESNAGFSTLLHDPEYIDVANSWNTLVVDKLSEARNSQVPSVVEWDKLHDKLLTFHYDDASQELFKARVAQPAGDLYMVYFQSILLGQFEANLNLYKSETEITRFCSLLK